MEINYLFFNNRRRSGDRLHHLTLLINFIDRSRWSPECEAPCKDQQEPLTLGRQ